MIRALLHDRVESMSGDESGSALGRIERWVNAGGTARLVDPGPPPTVALSPCDGGEDLELVVLHEDPSTSWCDTWLVADAGGAPSTAR
jgi:hypothetical protein